MVTNDEYRSMKIKKGVYNVDNMMANFSNEKYINSINIYSSRICQTIL